MEVIWPNSQAPQFTSVWPYKSAAFRVCAILLHFKMHICFEVFSGTPFLRWWFHLQRAHLINYICWCHSTHSRCMCHISSISGSFKNVCAHHHASPPPTQTPIIKSAFSYCQRHNYYHPCVYKTEQTIKRHPFVLQKK